MSGFGQLGDQSVNGHSPQGCPHTRSLCRTQTNHGVVSKATGGGDTHRQTQTDSVEPDATHKEQIFFLWETNINNMTECVFVRLGWWGTVLLLYCRVSCVPIKGPRPTEAAFEGCVPVARLSYPIYKI